jgi:hypothetical protein
MAGAGSRSGPVTDDRADQEDRAKATLWANAFVRDDDHGAWNAAYRDRLTYLRQGRELVDQRL